MNENHIAYRISTHHGEPFNHPLTCADSVKEDYENIDEDCGNQMTERGKGVFNNDSAIPSDKG